jgi:hypothetical protein
MKHWLHVECNHVGRAAVGSVPSLDHRASRLDGSITKRE